jgi:ABC-type arginine transport system permease subunit
MVEVKTSNICVFISKYAFDVYTQVHKNVPEAVDVFLLKFSLPQNNQKVLDILPVEAKKMVREMFIGCVSN